ncbi:hypothetical protein REPUB_Repub01dG0141200 [Reevesia pubescens]
MELDSTHNSNWLLDYAIPDFPPPAAAFAWPSPPSTLNAPSNVSAAVDCSFPDSDSLKEVVSRKRLKSESSGASGSKACREKLRRDRLNDRFLELGAILEPGRPPKADKVAMLSDAIRMVHQLRSEAQKLKESNEELQTKIKELKAEKNELRDEKQRVKADKEKLEQQVKVMSTRPGFLAHPTPVPAAFAAQGPAAGNKLMPFIGFPGVAMWQFMPPAAVDTSKDHRAKSTINTRPNPNVRHVWKLFLLADEGGGGGERPLGEGEVSGDSVAGTSGDEGLPGADSGVFSGEGEVVGAGDADGGVEGDVAGGGEANGAGDADGGVEGDVAGGGEANGAGDADGGVEGDVAGGVDVAKVSISICIPWLQCPSVPQMKYRFSGEVRGMTVLPSL